MQINLFILFIVFNFFQFGFFELVFGAPVRGGEQRHSSPPRPTRPAGMQEYHSSGYPSGNYGSSSPNHYVTVSPNNHGSYASPNHHDSYASSPVHSGARSPTRQGSQPVFSNGRPINAQNYARGQRDQQLVHTAVGAGAVAYGTGATVVGAGKVVKGIFTGNRAERHDGYQVAASGVFGACAGAAVCLMQGTRAVNNHFRAHSPQAATDKYQKDVNQILAASAQHHH